MGASGWNGSADRTKKRGQFILDDKPIGKGGFVKVYKGRSKLNPQIEVAVKKFNKKLLTPEEIQLIKDETDKLCGIDHPNVVKYYEWYENKKFLFVVSQFLEGETIGRQVERGKKDFTEYEVSMTIKQIWKALQYLHSVNIWHRNIKPENVMVDEASNVTLIDFGLARMTSKGKTIDTSKDVSQFTAPEFYKGICTERNDIWAVGNLTYYLISGKMPFSGDNIMSTFKKASHKNITFKCAIWKEITEECQNVIKGTIVGEPHHRFTANALLKHKWFVLVNEDIRKTEDDVVDKSIFDSLRSNKFSSKLQQTLIHLIVNILLDDEEFFELQRQFNMIDKDDDGQIAFDELTRAISKVYDDITEEEVKNIIQKFDFNQANTLNFSEFLTATISKDILHKSDNIKDLFKGLDTDDDNRIDARDIYRELQAIDTTLTKNELEELLDYRGSSKGFLSANEFKKLIESY